MWSLSAGLIAFTSMQRWKNLCFSKMIRLNTVGTTASTVSTDNHSIKVCTLALPDSTVSNLDKSRCLPTHLHFSHSPSLLPSLNSTTHHLSLSLSPCLSLPVSVSHYLYTHPLSPLIALSLPFSFLSLIFYLPFFLSSFSFLCFYHSISPIYLYLCLSLMSVHLSVQPSVWLSDVNRKVPLN